MQGSKGKLSARARPGGRSGVSSGVIAFRWLREIAASRPGCFQTTDPTFLHASGTCFYDISKAVTKQKVSCQQPSHQWNSHPDAHNVPMKANKDQRSQHLVYKTEYSG